MIAILLAGLAIREIFAPFTGHPFDFEIWVRLGYYVSAGQDPYKMTQAIPNLSMPGEGVLPSIGYPPIWPLFLAALYRIYLLTGINDRYLYYSILKQPMILSDLLDSYLIYRILRIHADEPRAFRAMAFWLFCPFTIIISSIWGMFDQMILVLVLMSLLLILETKASALSESLGILLKAIPLIYLPVLSFIQKKRSKKLLYLVISLGVSILFTLLPYLIFPSWKIGLILGTGTSVTNTIGSSANYWIVVYELGAFYGIPAFAVLVLQALSYLWIPSVIVGSLFCVLKLRKGSVDQKSVALSLLFVTLVFFLTRSQINEQYVIYFLGFGLIDYYALGSAARKKLFHAVWISALAFLIANNAFMVRFLDPISFYYVNLSLALTTGSVGEMRYGLLVVFGVMFSVFSFLYLRSLYFGILEPKTEKVTIEGTS